MIPAFDSEGFLPPGRFPATLTEIAAQLATTPRRQKVWDDFLDVTSVLMGEGQPICAAWIGGSFLSAKPDPGDVDVVYLIRRDVLVAPPRNFEVILGDLMTQRLRADGFDVDTYVLPWVPFAGHDTSKWSREYIEYQRARGYWDDFWMRRRDADPRTELNTHPRRGYLEVILDGYERTGARAA